jgi:hypothetical protein
MTKPLKYKEMMGMLEKTLAGLPEHRMGANGQYELKDAGLSAFSVFYMQAPSFLSWQQDMEKRKGRNNARSVFGIEKIPSVEQIKNLLDPMDEQGLGPAFWEVYHAFEARGQLRAYEGVKGTQLVSLDGTQHHASQKIHCEHCRVTVRKERAYYEHQVLMAVLCAPEQAQVICLEPEFITPQDGHDKQDCEQAAIKRWVRRHASEFTPWGVTILTDDLHCHQPTCELFIEHKMYFILTCKPDSHNTLYEELALLEQVEGAISCQTVRRWNGRHHETWVYRWAEQLPLRRWPDVLLVNWCELTVFNESTGEQMFHNAWATNHDVNEHEVEAIAASGRARWKVENEGINVLKNHGYQFQHNYGHGQQHLANVLLCLLLLAFLVHTVLHLSCETYQAIRQALGARRKFFNDLQALTRYLYFDSWQQLLTYMFQGLELESG